MGATVVDAFLRGHRGAWIGLLAVAFVAVVAVLVQRGPRATPGRLLLTSLLVSLLSAGGVLAGTALAIPRLVWKKAAVPPFMVPAGASWRSMRAPAAVVLAGGQPELGIAGMDADGRVRLFGLFSGAPLPELQEAPATPPEPGGRRICRVDREECRAWPRTWPEPGPPPAGSSFVWTRELLSHALAYDAESGLVLHHVEGVQTSSGAVAGAGAGRAGGEERDSVPPGDGWVLEQAGKLSNEPSREGPSALFVVRRLARGHVDAVRLISTPAGEGYTFAVERATTSLTAAPAAFEWFARPLLLALVLWFPFASLALQAAPAWAASRRRKRMDAGEPLSELPPDAATFQRKAREAMARALHGPAVLAVGLALSAPAVVAIVAMVSSR